jgi:hypothetical protein
MTVRTGQPGRNSQNGASRTGKTEQDCRHRTFRIGLLGQESQSRTAGTGHPEKDGPDFYDMAAERLRASANALKTRVSTSAFLC